jgi:hypothetical protein
MQQQIEAVMSNQPTKVKAGKKAVTVRTRAAKVRAVEEYSHWQRVRSELLSILSTAGLCDTALVNATLSALIAVMLEAQDGTLDLNYAKGRIRESLDLF